MIVHQRRGFEQVLVVLLGLGLVRLGNLFQGEAAVGLVGLVALDELHLDQVDDALELAGLADRQRADGRHDAQLRFHLLDAVEEVGAHTVELVDVGDARHPMLVGLIPHRLALHLDAADGAEDADGAVEDAQRALDLGGEIDVAGRVDQVDAHVAPVHRDGGTVDGDALGLLQGVEVRGGVALIDIAGLVLAAAEIEDALRGGGFARVHVCDDADVAQFVEHGL